MHLYKGILAACATVSVAILCGCESTKDPVLTPPAEVTVTALYIGRIDSVALPQVGNLMTMHTFVMTFFSDSTYSLDDTVTILLSNTVVPNAVEEGTFSKPGANYAFTPTSCASNTGVMSPANCGVARREGITSGTSITFARFLDDKDLVLSLQ